MTHPRSFKTILREFNTMPDEIRFYYQHLPNLIKSFPYEVSLAYMFYRLELSFNMTMYCCVVKLFATNPNLTYEAIQKTHFTRENFQDFFKKIFNEEMKKDLLKLLKYSEDIRDKVIHGKRTTDAEQREAIVDILYFSQGYNKQVSQVSGIRPIGKLQGFKGKAKSLDKNKSRWILKGIGFQIS